MGTPLGALPESSIPERSIIKKFSGDRKIRPESLQRFGIEFSRRSVPAISPSQRHRECEGNAENARERVSPLSDLPIGRKETLLRPDAKGRKLNGVEETKTMVSTD